MVKIRFCKLKNNFHLHTAGYRAGVASGWQGGI
jgi:hypothetical protein